MPESNRRITFAYFMSGWEYENGNRSQLSSDGVRAIPSEYQSEMSGCIFCPACFTNLIRVPKDRDHFSNGREAYFAHINKYRHISCNLRSKRAEGKRYDTYEEVRRAIDQHELVIVSSFIQEKPATYDTEHSEYDETAIEDLDGPQSQVPISRHSGKTFSLPSRITTIAGLCRNFNINLYRYFYFPNQQYAVRLIDLLHNVINITEVSDQPFLYYGKIVSSNHLGEYKRSDNIRMTKFEHSQDGVADFFLKMTDAEQKAHGITDDSVGRYVLIYGKVYQNGVGLCFECLGWGEYALLPEMYNSLLP